jgi:Tfp pilus assembly protein PilO
MRIFLMSAVVAAVLAAGWAFGLNSVQESIANAYVGSSVRLDQQERVNNIGREG